MVYLSLIRKDSIARMHDLAVHMKEGLPFAQHLSQKNSTDSYLCFWLALIHSVSCFFFHYQSPYWSLCTVFDSISSASDSPALLALFLSSEASICSTWFSLHLEIQMMLLPQFPMTFHQTQNEIPCFTV